MDMGIGPDTGRKISFTVQLSDPDDYEGGELELNTGKILKPPNARGTVALFPAFIMHRVTPVTTRNPLVAGRLGPKPASLPLNANHGSP